MTFQELRQKHPQFIYQGFEISNEDEDLKVRFNFSITPDIYFKPEIIFRSVPKERLASLDKNVLNNLIFNLGLVELLSYWKVTCSPQIIIKAGKLSEEQIKFWKKLLIRGLGEFFYTNKIDFTKNDLVKFVQQPERLQAEFTEYEQQLRNQDLVLVGGGKDSAVTLETISQKGKEFNSLILNPTEASIKMAEVAGSKNPIIINRTIDPKLIELNKAGYLNGHTPFSAYLAFLSVFTGVLYDYKNLVVSNEASSGEGNVIWMGQEINHQYSKTLEFENDFRDYLSKYLSRYMNYFSFLRSLGELQISETFSKMIKYHKIFRSCNKGSKQGIWCGKCPKCVSTYLLLYPFLVKKTAEIFGKDLFEDENLIPIVRRLLRENDEMKPFECVATVEEIKTAISLSLARAKKDDQKIPKVLQAFKNQKTLILGFGREGKATLDYFKKHFPDTEIGIADKKEGENYLDKIKDYDVIIKSPGIPYLPEIKKAKEKGKTITSATKIFFENFKGTIIGITGTKGKSTTASLIYEVLKQNGVDAYLIGNIGKPALDLLDQLDRNSVVVYELSSFQLEDLDQSPHIAVITNLYPEHLDHHGDFSAYVNAKSNIAKYQTENDYLIYNQDILWLQEIAGISRAQKMPYSKQDANMVTSLLGEHNLLNTIPAILIGKLFNISDEIIAKTVINFKPLPHRLEFVGVFKGIKFYNDSLATIPQATIGALQALGGNVETLITGGFDRGIDYSVLGEAIGKSNIKTLILFPDTGEKIWNAFNKYSKKPLQRYDVNNMEEAVKKSFKVTTPEKICLLSPASSSFNLFKDYEDRGDQFTGWIRKLGAN